jgi:hypothetical protein
MVAGTACAACCAVPLAGALGGGAALAALSRECAGEVARMAVPAGAAVAVAMGVAWWWRRRRRAATQRDTCACPTACDVEACRAD